MSKILFVTTTNDRLFEEYAETFFDEFETYAGEDISLVNYVDLGTVNIFKKNYKKIYSKFLESHQHTQFLKFFGNLKQANGYMVKKDKDNKIKGVIHSYRYNAIRYSYKVFAMYQAFQLALIENYQSLIWIDADIRCKKKFTVEDIKEFLPNTDELMAYLGRTHFPLKGPHSETGFLAFNIHHNDFKNFIEEIIDVYTSGKIFSLKQWHDCWVFDTIRKKYQDQKFIFKNLSGKFEIVAHPFVCTNLGKYFDHLKGDRKEGKSSFADDFIDEKELHTLKTYKK
jgi:hypothetical protein